MEAEVEGDTNRESGILAITAGTGREPLLPSGPPPPPPCSLGVSGLMAVQGFLQGDRWGEVRLTQRDTRL